MTFLFIIGLVLLVAFSFLTYPSVAFAHCPLCVAGAAAGITLTRWVGVDDAISGVWIAALLGAVSFWTNSLVLGRFNLPLWVRIILKPLIYILVFGLTIWSFYKFSLVIRMSQIFGVDKLTFGMILGGVVFYLVDLVNFKRFFPYQRLILSLSSMTVLSLGIYVLLNYFI